MFSCVMDYKFELWCLWLLISLVCVIHNKFPFVLWYSIISNSFVAVICDTQNAMHHKSHSYTLQYSHRIQAANVICEAYVINIKSKVKFMQSMET